jgi:hypothetical protein
MVRPRKNCELIGGKSGPKHMIFVLTDVISEATVSIVGEMFATFVAICGARAGISVRYGFSLSYRSKKTSARVSDKLKHV